MYVSYWIITKLDTFIKTIFTDFFNAYLLTRSLFIKKSSAFAWFTGSTCYEADTLLTLLSCIKKLLSALHARHGIHVLSPVSHFFLLWDTFWIRFCSKHVMCRHFLNQKYKHSVDEGIGLSVLKENNHCSALINLPSCIFIFSIHALSLTLSSKLK